MRRTRRGGGIGHEFGGSGEDSFVAVVVTKLTGALLFILLLTMVIMALVPKAADLATPHSAETADTPPELTITTPERLPEAIVGRPYAVALAATGGRGRLTWAVDGALPRGLLFAPETGVIRGTPETPTPEPIELVIRVCEDTGRRAARSTQLIVYEPEGTLGLPSKWAPAWPSAPLRAWLNQGFGFLLLILVHLVGVGTINSLEWQAQSARAAKRDDPVGFAVAEPSIHRRYRTYRNVLRVATLGAISALALWLLQASVGRVPESSTHVGSVKTPEVP